jgi:hypothetical protein
MTNPKTIRNIRTSNGRNKFLKKKLLRQIIENQKRKDSFEEAYKRAMRGIYEGAGWRLG